MYYHLKIYLKKKIYNFIILNLLKIIIFKKKNNVINKLSIKIF